MTAYKAYERDHREALLDETKRLLRRYSLSAKKGLGQHFLVDRTVLQKVVSAAELSTADTVVEVGPGLGVLTGELAGKAGTVIAVELDGKLAALLEQNLKDAGNISVVNADILRVEPADFIGEAGSYKVVANLPYYITSAVLRYFLEASLKPRLMVVMLQKEVAEAIVAEPGAMSLLSVSVQFYGKPQIVGYVPAGSFYPPPEVDSAILKIDVYPQLPAVGDTETFFGLVRAGFCTPRKQLANSLSLGMGLPKAEVLFLLDRAGIIYRRRAETLSIEEWQRLWRLFKEE